MNEQNRETESLHWRAYLYVAGELDSSESEQFERFLENDQSAREAVAAAVELGEAVRMAGSAKGLSRTWRGVGAAIAAAGFAGLLAVPLFNDSRPSVEYSMNDAPTSEIVSNWVQLRVAGPVEAVAGEPYPHTEEEFAGDVEVPSWLDAALTLSDAEDAAEPSREGES